MKFIPCPVCGSNNHKYLKRGTDDTRKMRCLDCGKIYTIMESRRVVLHGSHMPRWPAPRREPPVFVELKADPCAKFRALAELTRR